MENLVPWHIEGADGGGICDGCGATSPQLSTWVVGDYLKWLCKKCSGGIDGEDEGSG